MALGLGVRRVLLMEGKELSLSLHSILNILLYINIVSLYMCILHKNISLSVYSSLNSFS